MDATVLAFACLLALGTGVAFGLAPALEGTGVDAVETLKDGGHGLSEGRRTRRMRSLLVILEVALALILLTAAGLLVRSFFQLRQVDEGFQVRGNYMTNIVLNPRKYPTDAARTAFVDQAIAEMQKASGITAVAFTNHTLPTMGMGRTFFTIAGRPIVPIELPPAFYYAVTPDYFRIFGIPLVRGRLFTAADVAGQPRVVLINRKLAELHFPDSDPIGQKISVGSNPEVWREIIGIVADTHQNGPAQPVRSQIYEPFAQNPSTTTSVVINTTLPTASVIAATATAVHAVDPDIPLPTLYPLDVGMPRALVPMRFATLLFSIFGATALFLAAIGVYGVMSYSVSQRTGEIGLRMALGAQRRDVLWMIFRHGGRMVGAGLLLGLAGSLAVTHLLGILLFEVSPYDPLTLVANMLLLSIVAFVACWLPARRATKVEPMVALHCE
jgi:putative ABC transport system permease protein